ncbi:MAG: hypothetical protein HY718_04305, partial [Planctomycetes bacterium]|nr:hypothetical protein [Planctomycetota bacterium]
MRTISVAVAICVLSTAGLAAAQPIFHDQFDSYSGTYLAASSAGVWILDGCNDGRLGGDPFSGTKAVADWKDGSTNLRLGYRNRHDLTAAEMANAAVVHGGTPTCVNGTDDNPLVFTFYIELGPKTSNVYYHLLNIYTELSCGSERAPTPMLIADCTGKIRPHLNLEGDGQPHRSIAIGQIAWADTDPCDPPTSQVPQNFRLTVYDGLRWKILQSPVDMHTCGAYNFVTATVKTATIDLELKSFYNGSTCTGDAGGNRITYTTSIAREYTGPFTAVKIGGIPRDPADGTGCWGQDNAPVNAYPTQGTDIDDVLLQGGEAYDIPAPCDETGACCLPDRVTCQQVPASVCAGIEGATFKGTATICGVGPGKCCADVPFDADFDGDVDMADFAKLQRCLTIGGGTVADECKCIDFDDSGAIDATEVEKFALCASGEGIP